MQIEVFIQGEHNEPELQALFKHLSGGTIGIPEDPPAGPAPVNTGFKIDTSTEAATKAVEDLKANYTETKPAEVTHTEPEPTPAEDPPAEQITHGDVRDLLKDLSKVSSVKAARDIFAEYVESPKDPERPTLSEVPAEKLPELKAKVEKALADHEEL